MAAKYDLDQLMNMDQKDVALMFLALQDRVDSLDSNMEKLIEQIRISNQYRFGSHTEKLGAIDGQLCLFDEAEAFSDPDAPEPEMEEVVQAYKRKKQKGKRDSDLEGFPVEEHPHDIPEEVLNDFYGKGNWKAMPSETFRRLRYEPASWTVELHTVSVYVGTGGYHQDEFLRGERPKDLIKKSLATPSLGSAILNGKFVNALPLNRISQEFDRNGLTLSRQTMSNWILAFSEYFRPLWQRMKEHLLLLSVIQADETPTQVIHDERPPGVKGRSYMWVYRSGELCRGKPIVLYEYQKTRHHDHSKEFLNGYNGVVVSDGASQYHLLEDEVPGITSANCWAHARRAFADACKASGKSNGKALKHSTAHQALELIGKFYSEDEKLKELSADERLEQRQIKVKPLVEAYFSWVRERLSSNEHLPKGKTAEGLQYCLNQEKYLKVFLTDGNVPIDNSAAERAIRPFCVGKKNWLFMNTIKGAQASAICYSIAESAKANNLKPYEYFKHLLMELPNRVDDDGNIDTSALDDLMPWAEELPEVCYKRR